MGIEEVDVHAKSHLHLIRFGILHLSETKRPDYKSSSCTATQFALWLDYCILSNEIWFVLTRKTHI